MNPSFIYLRLFSAQSRIVGDYSAQTGSHWFSLTSARVLVCSRAWPHVVTPLSHFCGCRHIC